MYGKGKGSKAGGRKNSSGTTLQGSGQPVKNVTEKQPFKGSTKKK